MPSLNKVHLIGLLGRDPEVRYTPNGNAVANISIATTRSWKDKTSGDKVEETEWHRVVFYDHLAEIAGEYLQKGDPCYIEGRLKTRKWEKDGVDHYTTEIIAENLQLLGQRREKADNADRGASRKPATDAPPARGNPAGRTAPPARQPAQSTSTGFDDMSDDIPW